MNLYLYLYYYSILFLLLKLMMMMDKKGTVIRFFCKVSSCYVDAMMIAIITLLL